MLLVVEKFVCREPLPASLKRTLLAFAAIVASPANAQMFDPDEITPETSERPAFEAQTRELPFDATQMRDLSNQQGTPATARTADASIGEVGQRLSRDELTGTASPYSRVDTRLDTRIQGRIQNRLDRHYESVEENQEDQRRRSRPKI